MGPCPQRLGLRASGEGRCNWARAKARGAVTGRVSQRRARILADSAPRCGPQRGAQRLGAGLQVRGSQGHSNDR